jgi:hypothetical protein
VEEMACRVRWCAKLRRRLAMKGWRGEGFDDRNCGCETGKEIGNEEWRGWFRGTGMVGVKLEEELGNEEWRG